MTLFALMVMALHPQPSPDILLPYMSPNLAQILHTWVAFVLITGSAPVPEWNIGQQHIHLTIRGAPANQRTCFHGTVSNLLSQRYPTNQYHLIGQQQKFHHLHIHCQLSPLMIHISENHRYSQTHSRLPDLTVSS
jgi:hypothetical protein